MAKDTKIMTTTSAFVSTVKSDRTITVPDNIPVGAKVAVVLLPQEEIYEDSDTRNLRFQKVMDAIREANENNYSTPEISQKELDRLIDDARQAAKV